MMLSTRYTLGPVKLSSSKGSPPPDKGNPSWWGDVVEKAKDLKEAASLLIGGSIYLKNKKAALALEQVARPLSELNDVVMNRPLVLCPGWNTELHKFDFLADKLLASGQNGAEAVYLQQGQAFRDPECRLPLDQIPSNSKVFVNIWDTRKTPPDGTAPQLKQNLELVQRALGDAKVDVVGYSMGGLATRKYLDGGGSGIGNFMTLGTPHQGTRFAQMSGRVIDREVAWAMKFAGLSQEDSGAMQWLAAGSPKLEELNQRWPQQRAQVDNVVMVSGRHELTPSVSWKPFTKGDGLVETANATLPNTPTVVLSGGGFLHHGTLPHDSQAFHEMEKFFGWQTLATNSSDPTIGDYANKPQPLTPYEDM